MSDPADDDPLLRFKLSLVAAIFALSTVAVAFQALVRHPAPERAALVSRRDVRV
jgi:hypothetical protein